MDEHRAIFKGIRATYVYKYVCGLDLVFPGYSFRDWRLAGHCCGGQRSWRCLPASISNSCKSGPLPAIDPTGRRDSRKICCSRASQVLPAPSSKMGNPYPLGAKKCCNGSRLIRPYFQLYSLHPWAT